MYFCSLMVKTKSAYFCQSCGYNSPKWLGRCPVCNSWNTFVEELIQKEESKPGSWKPAGSSIVASKPRRLTEISVGAPLTRITTGNLEFDRVLGGGIVPGSLVLIGGEPGIGKSTLLLQIAVKLNQLKVLYVSGEESEEQILMRAKRLGSLSEECYLFAETNTQNLFKQIELLQPDLLIIDSIQTLQSAFIESAAGSISQVRECTAELMKFAKESNTPVFLIGHITKEGTLAGPKVLEHMVDTVLQFEGDRHLNYRILRTIKNRFGSTSELGIYEMQGSGLREVSNPSEILLSHRQDKLSGVAIASAIEGNRPFLVELQALVSPATYGTPQRSVTGYDLKRLQMLLAVLEKRGGKRMGLHDVYLNVTGGIRLEDPAIDLAVCMAILSSFEDQSLPDGVCFSAEIGLGGEVRPVAKIENRVAEAEKLGFEQIFISSYSLKSLEPRKTKIKVVPVDRLDEVYQALL